MSCTLRQGLQVDVVQTCIVCFKTHQMQKICFYRSRKKAIFKPILQTATRRETRQSGLLSFAGSPSTSASVIPSISNFDIIATLYLPRRVTIQFYFDSLLYNTVYIYEFCDSNVTLGDPILTIYNNRHHPFNLLKSFKGLLTL